MSFALAALAALAVLVVLAVRASRRRAAALDEALRSALERRFERGLSWTERRVAHEATGGTLDRLRMRRAARKVEDVERVAEVAASLLRQPLSLLPGPLSLKVHGPRVSLHLVDPIALDLLAPSRRPVGRPEPELGLTATYRVDQRADQCLSEDHLREQAIDSLDLHGIALAVLRQGFDEELAGRLNAGGAEVVESRDGSAAALLLVLPDFLDSAAGVEARLEGADRLLLRPDRKTPGGGAHPTLDLELDDQGWKVL